MSTDDRLSPAGHALTAWLDRTGRTQPSFALELGISYTTLRKFMTGLSVPSLNLAYRIKELTGIDPEVFRVPGARGPGRPTVGEMRRRRPRVA